MMFLTGCSPDRQFHQHENRGESVINPLKAHSIDTFVDVLKLNPAYSGMRIDSIIG